MIIFWFTTLFGYVKYFLLMLYLQNDRNCIYIHGQVVPYLDAAEHSADCGTTTRGCRRVQGNPRFVSGVRSACRLQHEEIKRWLAVPSLSFALIYGPCGKSRTTHDRFQPVVHLPQYVYTHLPSAGLNQYPSQVPPSIQQ